MVEVDIVSTGKHYLMGELVQNKKAKRPESVPAPLKKGQISGLNQVYNNSYVNIKAINKKLNLNIKILCLFVLLISYC